jgi:protoporphyrinogen oxidase
LNTDELFMNTEVTEVQEQQVITADGQVWKAPFIIIATEGQSDLLKNIQYPEIPEYKGTTVLYFGSDVNTDLGAMLALMSGKEGLVNHVIELSAVAPELAPQGKHLISVSINGVSDLADHELETTVKDELSPYINTKQWELLRIYRVPHALPAQGSVLGEVKPGRFAFKEGVYVCGDFHLYGSQNAALRMGRTAAEHIVHQYKARA